MSSPNRQLQHSDQIVETITRIYRSGLTTTSGGNVSVRDVDKVSLISPLGRLQNWLPGNWQDIPRRIEASSPDAVLLRSYILSLTDESVTSSSVRGEHLSEAAVALLAGSLHCRRDEKQEPAGRSTENPP